MKILHICAGWQKWNGAANVARMIMDEQRHEGHEVSFATWAKVRELRAADEVWIHCGWLPCLWWAALWGWNVRWMPHGNLDPVRLRYHAWKKWLVGPIERWCLRRCGRIVATCEAEKGWIEKYLGKRCPTVEVTDVKRFFKLVSGGVESGRVGSGGVGEFGSGGVAKNSQLITHNTQLHLLYLGRRHPLKGVEYLEQAVAELNSNLVNPVNPVQNSSTCSTCPTYPKNSAPSISQHLCVRFVSNAYGEELEKVWDWCDVLVLPTLSDNFGLVVAEALERGKRVITTDGAPAWEEGLELRVESGGVEELRVGSDIWSGYEGRLIYLKGYRDGTPQERVRLLKSAITAYLPNILHKCDRFDLSPRTNGKSKCSETRPMGAGRR